MSLKENPRPKLMADLKNLCRNFDKQVHEADMAARAALHYKRGGSMASDRWRDEVQELKADIESNLSTVIEERNNLTSFLGEMSSEMRRIIERTQRMSKFMEQYGYTPEHRLDVDQLLNWENDEKDDDDNDKDDNDKNLAPAAATEFASEVSAGGEESSVEPISVCEASVTAPTTTSKPINKSPSVFDIGLSKYGMDALLGKSQAKPSVTKLNPPPARLETIKAHETPRIDREYLLTSSSAAGLPCLLDESKYESSPVLKLNFRPLPLPVSIDESTIDITPGLTSRRKPQPMRPQVMSSNTPETPELETVNIKNILNQPQPIRPQEISSNTPETPELETVNIKDILKCSKNINPKTHIEPAASTITPEMPHLETTVLSNTTNTYKSPMVSKTIIDKSGTPETPEFTSDYMKTLLAARDKPKVQARPTPEFPDLNYLKKD